MIIFIDTTLRFKTFSNARPVWEAASHFRVERVIVFERARAEAVLGSAVLRGRIYYYYYYNHC